MRTSWVRSVVLGFVFAAAASPGFAQQPQVPEAQAIRAELERLRQEFDSLRQQYRGSAGCAGVAARRTRRRTAATGRGRTATAGEHDACAGRDRDACRRRRRGGLTRSAADLRGGRRGVQGLQPRHRGDRRLPGRGRTQPAGVVEPALEMHEAELSFQAVVDPYARADFFVSFGQDRPSTWRKAS